MNFWQAILSGIVQGLTEFLPISSSGHLAVLHHWFGFKEPQLQFDIFLHLGTLFAVLVFFRKDIADIFINRRKKLLSLIILAALPVYVLGFLFYPFIEKSFVNIKLVAAALIITALWLILGQSIGRITVKRQPGIINSCLVGISQAIALIPGISRSGATISTGLICGLEKKEAVKFSFLLSIPAILGAGLYQLHITLLRQGFGGQALCTLHILNIDVIFGMIFAFLSGYVAIKILISAVIKEKLHIFAVYCYAAGLLILIFG